MGLLRGTFWEGNFVGMASGEELPAQTVPDRSEEAIHASLTTATEIGLVYANDQRPYVLHTLPAAFDTLLGLAAATRHGDLDRALEKYCARYWASTADALRTQGLPDADKVPDILAFCGVEEGNLRHALEIAERGELWEEARPVLFILLNVWHRTGRAHDAARLREHWLGLISDGDGHPRLPDDPRLCDLWRFLWGNHANWLLTQGRHAEAEAIHRRVAAEEEGRDQPDETVLGGIYFQIARTYEDRQMWQEALDWQNKSLAIRTRLTDPHGMAACHHQLGLIALGRKEPAEALRHFDEAIAIRERAEDVAGQAASYFQGARALRDLGDMDRAQKYLGKAIEGYHIRSDQRQLAAALQQMASLRFAQGDLDECEAAAKRAMEIRSSLADVVGMAANAGQLARVEEGRDNPSGALRWLLQAFGLLSRGQSPQAQLAAAQIRRLRDSVGADRFAPIWEEVAEGAPMPPWLAS
jgi:tetratricopeptide (TPR) repeat protein